MDIDILGPRGGETKVLLDNGKDFRSDLLNKIFVKKNVGTRIKQIITENRTSTKGSRKTARTAGTALLSNGE